MLISKCFHINTVVVMMLIVNSSVFADEQRTNVDEPNTDTIRILTSEELHAQLNAIYKNNKLLKTKIIEKDQALNEILSTLKLLNDKIEYKINSNNVVSNKTEFTMADFNSKGDDLIRKCDEIVDNYYSRKSLQEKNYVQNLYSTEQVDPQWEREIEDNLQSFLDSNNLAQSELINIDCKNSVCKMRVQHKSKPASQEFRNNLRNDSNWDVYNSQNNFDRATGGIITSVTLLRNSKEVRKFIWGK